MARTKTATKPDTPIEAQQRLHAIGVIRSTLTIRSEAPRQGREGAPDAWLEVRRSVAKGLDGIGVGDEIVVVTWLHRARGLRSNVLGAFAPTCSGVFASTCSGASLQRARGASLQRARGTSLQR